MITEVTEDYVPYGIAKLLKEKGFDEPTVYEYGYFPGNSNLLFAPSGRPIVKNSETQPHLYAAPTLQMACKWLRKVHNIDIEIHAEVGMLGTKVYMPMVSTYKTFKADSEKLTQFKRGIYYKDDIGVVPALQYYHTYEEACEEGIKYCLENLI